jgi:hypothetical protein
MRLNDFLPPKARSQGQIWHKELGTAWRCGLRGPGLASFLGPELFYPRPLGSAADYGIVIEGARRLRSANETDRESWNAVVGPLAHLDRADSIVKSEVFWTRSCPSCPRHCGRCLDPAGGPSALPLLGVFG